MPPKTSENAVFTPNKGLFLDRSPVSIPSGGLRNGENFRIQAGRLSNINLGHAKFPDSSNAIVLSASTRTGFSGSPCTLIATFLLRSGSQKLIFGTPLDLFEYDEGNTKVLYITPTYNTGTVSLTNGSTAVVGTTTLWTANAKAGDYVFFTSNSQRDLGGWYKIASITNNTNLVLTQTYAGSTSGSENYIIRKVFTATITDFWRSETFLKAQPGNADLWFATNGVDRVVTWNATDSTVTVTNLPFSICKELTVYQNTMIYANLVVSGEARPNSIANSDAATPEDMSSGIAAEFVIHDSASPILAVEPLGDNLVIYGKDFGVLAQLVEGDLGFIFRKVIQGFGPAASRLVTNFGDFHEFVGAGSLYRFDGVSLRSIGEHVWRSVLQAQDLSRIQMAFHHRDDENGDVIWVVPLTGDANTSAQKTPRTAYMEHFLERISGQRAFEELRAEEFVPFSRRDFPFTASGFFERSTSLTWATLTEAWETNSLRWNDRFFVAGFPLSLVGDETGNIFILGASQDANGSALASFVRSGDAVIGDGRQRNLVTRVYPFTPEFPASGGYTLGVTVHVSDTASGATTATDRVGFDMTHAGNHFVSVFRRGRYVDLEFGTAGPQEPWELDGWDIDVRQGGLR